MPSAHPGATVAAPAPTGNSSDATNADGAAGAAQADGAQVGQAPTQLSAAALVDQQAAASAASPLGSAGTKTRDDPVAGVVSTTTDAMPPGLQQHVPAAAPAAPSTPAAEASANLAASLHPATEQLAANLQRAAKDGSNQISFELTPPSLGKIEVRLDFGHDGRLSAVISADRADTLNMLSGDSKTLTQSLRDAGVQVDSGSLSFNLRGDGSNSGQRQFAQSSFYGNSTSSMAEDDSVGAVGVIAASATSRGHAGNLDIQV